MKSLRFRLIGGVGLLLALAVGGFALFIYSVTAQWLTFDVEDRVADKAAVFAAGINKLEPSYTEYLQRAFKTDAMGYHFTIFNLAGHEEGRSFGSKEPVPFATNAARLIRAKNFSQTRSERLGGLPDYVPTNPPAQSLIESLSVRNRRFPDYWPTTAYLERVQGASGETYVTATIPVNYYHDTEKRPLITAWVQAAVPLTTLTEHLHLLRLWLTGGSLAAVAIGLILTWYLTGLWLRSLRTAAESAEQLSTGDFARRRLTAPTDEPEVVRLITAFNRLLDRLSESHVVQQRLVADASHELRTPLTILRGEIQVALRKERSPERYRAVLASNGEEIVRLCRLVENLLALAHADAGEAVVKREPVDWGVLSADVCAKFSALADTGHTALRCESAGTVTVSGDAIALESVLANLVENAVRHSPPDEEVLVRVSEEGPQVKVEVIDHGVGIAAEHLPYLFERFYRVDKARSRQFGGAGLGLAIVKTLVEAHGGRVEVRSEVGVGSTFTVRLPRLG
ncbi:MAG TPA: ATP-binding protein [Verrucomicrobiota bacterium]|nr:hypothetical protein [Verrucomicrobiales bacterium]HRI13935.1 ATP-binding protein [Verrucomicrobiota bacterium]